MHFAAAAWVRGTLCTWGGRPVAYSATNLVRALTKFVAPYSPTSFADPYLRLQRLCDENTFWPLDPQTRGRGIETRADSVAEPEFVKRREPPVGCLLSSGGDHESHANCAACSQRRLAVGLCRCSFCGGDRRPPRKSELVAPFCHSRCRVHLFVSWQRRLHLALSAART